MLVHCWLFAIALGRDALTYGHGKTSDETHKQLKSIDPNLKDW
tara:strand:+ start:790 stop:918 length:129 start_codon:yes stop_codon:yes gene_type:complete